MTIGVALVDDAILTEEGRPPPVQVALPMLVRSGDAMILIVSPGAMRAAVAPLVMVLHRVANDVPAAASLPFSKSM
jgi:hypothetical protein